MNIKLVAHYTDSDKLGSDYWGWIASAVFFVSTMVLGIRYWWERRNYKTAIEDIQETTPIRQNNNQAINENPKDEIQNNNLPNANNSPIDNPTVNSVSTPVNIPNSNNNSSQNQLKLSKTTYILLAVFLGIFGVHHFYNHKIIFGFLHLIWLICFIIPFFAMEQLALIFLLSFVLLPITFIVGLVQALVKGLSKE